MSASPTGKGVRTFWAEGKAVREHNAPHRFLGLRTIVVAGGREVAGK